MRVSVQPPMVAPLRSSLHLSTMLVQHQNHSSCLCSYIFLHSNSVRWFPGGTSGKNLPAIAGDTRDSWVGKIPWSRKWPPLQYSCLEDYKGRGAWRSTAHEAAKSQTLLSS